MEASEELSFGKALDALKFGDIEGITRSNWYGSQASPVVRLQRPDDNSKMTEPYLYMEKTSLRENIEHVVRFPLDLSCESILADDWIVVD